MHELAIAQSVVETVCSRAGGRRVHRVTLRIGALTAVVPEAMSFSFDLATEGTVASGARLEMLAVPAAGQCRACGAAGPIDGLLCPCGSADVEVTAGRELQIVSMEVG
ncbi:hydrogenase maturation nickel metallochaperone HypA/HybF [Paractinoplanes hotanensis]|uniref:Hydrogenase maturation factor HypA n=1 Tax=Paractinoplanes hotanensis TaxID=2906497 RepID=A0ABT0Y4K0_9ACTN|nr:hydrogenase maturation nickel metallochaperone HypA [Actinoplanes hotanensis]MCM4080965.1 hydrogenase maturation nickel metallochaperone HypA [Actinoplanes hotanensis]